MRGKNRRGGELSSPCFPQHDKAGTASPLQDASTQLLTNTGADRLERPDLKQMGELRETPSSDRGLHPTLLSLRGSSPPRKQQF